MSDETIANLPSGSPAVSTDQIPIQRGASTFKLTVADFSSASPVASVFGRAGAVTAQSGDYTVVQITGAAPLASPVLTGTPTAPTQAALTNNTDIATTAYADLAVGVETTRATTAEGLKAPLAAPSFTGTVNFAGNENLASGQVLQWNADTGVSRLGAASLALGNGTAADFSGQLKLAGITYTSTTTSGTTAAIRFGGASGNPFIYSDDSTYIAMNDSNGIALQLNGSLNQCIVYKQLLAGSAALPVTAGGTAGVGGIAIQGPGVENLGLLWTASTKTFSLVNAGGTATSAWTVDSGIIFDVPKLIVDSTITKYNGVTTVANGAPSEYATINVTGQAASIGSTTLYAVPAAGAGMYRISYYLDVSTAGVGGTLTATFGWTDANSTESITSASISLGGVTGDFTQGTIVFYSKASVNVTYLTTFTIGTGSPQYEIRARLEFLG